MKIYKEEHLKNFKSRGDSISTMTALTDDELDIVEHILEEDNPDGVNETDLNDFLKLEKNTIAIWLGYKDWEDLLKNRKNVVVYKDDIAFHPSYYVADIIQDMGISQSKFAKKLDITEKKI